MLLEVRRGFSSVPFKRHATQGYRTVPARCPGKAPDSSAVAQSEVGLSVFIGQFSFSPLPRKPRSQHFQVYFSPLFGPFQALTLRLSFQPQKRLLVSNRGLMPTAKQTAANRMNAQKSTGPRTTAGKAVSRFNALKHGIYAIHQIMFDEKPEDLAEPPPSITILQPRRCQATLPRRYARCQRMAPPPHAPRRSRALADRQQRLPGQKYRNHHNLHFRRRLRHRFRHLRAPPTSRQFLRAHLAPRRQRVATPPGSGISPWPARFAARSRARPHTLPCPQPQPQPPKPTSANMGSIRQNPKNPGRAVPQPPLAPTPTLAETSTRPSDRFPTSMETVDAAPEAIFKQK